MEENIWMQDFTGSIFPPRFHQDHAVTRSSMTLWLFVTSLLTALYVCIDGQLKVPAVKFKTSSFIVSMLSPCFVSWHTNTSASLWNKRSQYEANGTHPSQIYDGLMQWSPGGLDCSSDICDGVAGGWGGGGFDGGELCDPSGVSSLALPPYQRSSLVLTTVQRPLLRELDCRLNEAQNTSDVQKNTKICTPQIRSLKCSKIDSLNIVTAFYSFFAAWYKMVQPGVGHPWFNVPETVPGSANWKSYIPREVEAELSMTFTQKTGHLINNVSPLQLWTSELGLIANFQSIQAEWNIITPWQTGVSQV